MSFIDSQSWTKFLEQKNAVKLDIIAKSFAYFLIGIVKGLWEGDWALGCLHLSLKFY